MTHSGPTVFSISYSLFGKLGRMPPYEIPGSTSCFIFSFRVFRVMGLCLKAQQNSVHIQMCSHLTTAG